MAYRIASRGGRIVEVPIAFADRERGNSKMSGRIVVEALILVTGWGVRDRLRRMKRRALQTFDRSPVDEAARP